MTEVLKKVCVRTRTGSSSVCHSHGGQAFKAAFAFSRFSFQRGTGCASTLGMLIRPFWASWSPHFGTCWHSTQQSQTLSPPFAPAPHHLSGQSVGIWGQLGEKVHPQADTQEITTFLSCQTATHLHLQSRGCHLALCAGL